MSPTAILLMATMIQPPAENRTNHEDGVRDAIQRSIPFVEKKGNWWIEEKNCVSCHRVGNMVWSLTAARKNGFFVSDQLDQWISWTIDASLKENEDGKIVGAGNAEGVAQIVLTLQLEGARATDSQGDDRSKEVEQLVELIAGGQLPDDSWKPGGQLPSQKRAKEETSDVSSMWNSLAMCDPITSGSKQAAVKAAIDRIKKRPDGKSTEWYVAGLLLAQEVNDEEWREKLLGQLRDQQQDDGGWGWIVGEESDALGTGMSLYALIKSGVDRGDPIIVDAQKFLLETQREDGSWAVKGTKEKKQEQIQETAVFWGTSWATLGLVESLSK